MADYPNEIVDMILVLGECHNNYDAVKAFIAERFPDRRQHDIQRLTQRARNGHLIRQRRHHEFKENDAQVITILAVVHLDLHISTRQFKREIGIPQSTVSRILKALRYYPYHITLTQALKPNHIQLRIAFCQWALRIIRIIRILRIIE